MSEEQLKAFIAIVQADKDLQKRLKAEGADAVAIAKENGFVFTTEDITTYENQKLSDKELETAAGGRNTWKAAVSADCDDLCTELFSTGCFF